jgi:hypothetical protein
MSQTLKELFKSPYKVFSYGHKPATEIGSGITIKIDAFYFEDETYKKLWEVSKWVNDAIREKWERDFGERKKWKTIPDNCELCRYSKNYGAVGDRYCKILEDYITGNVKYPFKERSDECPIKHQPYQCPECKKYQFEATNFCPHCGTPLDPSEEGQTP